jgi:hypothetical protein
LETLPNYEAIWERLACLLHLMVSEWLETLPIYWKIFWKRCQPAGLIIAPL